VDFEITGGWKLCWDRVPFGVAWRSNPIRTATLLITPGYLKAAIATPDFLRHDEIVRMDEGDPS
jgi:hypothetical protein